MSGPPAHLGLNITLLIPQKPQLSLPKNYQITFFSISIGQTELRNKACCNLTPLFSAGASILSIKFSQAFKGQNSVPSPFSSKSGLEPRPPITPYIHDRPIRQGALLRSLGKSSLKTKTAWEEPIVLWGQELEIDLASQII